MPTIALTVPLAVGAWLLTILLLVIYFVFLQRSFGRLRDSHIATWRELGQPHVLSGNGASYPARRFLWSKKCQDLGDDLLLRQARLSYYFGMTAAVLGLVLIAALAYNATIGAM